MSIPTIYDVIEARLPSRLALMAKLNANASTPVQTMTVGNVMGGLRGLSCMLWEISGTAPTGELAYHGKNLVELDRDLPKWPGTQQISPEAMLWWLYTASVPTTEQFHAFVADLRRRAEQIPGDVTRLCDSLPTSMDANTQLATCFTAYGPHSKFLAALGRGVHKKDLWKYALDDVLDATAASVIFSARIYINKVHGGKGRDAPLDHTGDLAHNFSHRIGMTDPAFADYVRLTFAVAMDHGANVSEHVMRLSGTAWTDPYSSLASAMLSGKGQLHTGAITVSVRHMKDMAASVAAKGGPVEKAIEEHTRETLKSGSIVPGYGHAMLRGQDARLTLVLRFIEMQAKASLNSQKSVEGGSLKTEMLDLIIKSIDIVPEVLKKEVPKIKSPSPNVDALSGSLFWAMGLHEDYALLMLLCGRGMGCGALYLWDRALVMPLERPLSLTLDQMAAKL